MCIWGGEGTKNGSGQLRVSISDVVSPETHASRCHANREWRTPQPHNLCQNPVRYLRHMAIALLLDGIRIRKASRNAESTMLVMFMMSTTTCYSLDGVNTARSMNMSLATQHNSGEIDAAVGSERRLLGSKAVELEWQCEWLRYEWALVHEDRSHIASSTRKCSRATLASSYLNVSCSRHGKMCNQF